MNARTSPNPHIPKIIIADNKSVVTFNATTVDKTSIMCHALKYGIDNLLGVVIFI